MKSLPFLLKVGVATSLAGISVVGNAIAADSTEPKTQGTTMQGAVRQGATTQGAIVEQSIRLRYVTPRLMMWLLDPNNQTEPREITSSRKNLESAGFVPQATKLEKKRVSHLPMGVTRIAPHHVANAIVVSGSVEGIERVRRLIAVRDERLQQISVEVTTVEIDPADAKSLFVNGAVAGEARVEGSGSTSKIAVHEVQGNFRERLKELVEQKKAKILQAPRVTAIDSVTARLATTRFAPAIVGINDETGQFTALSERFVNDGRANLFVAVEWGVAVTPTILQNDSIALVLMPSRTVNLTGGKPGAGQEQVRALPLLPPSNAKIVTTVKDDSTIALTDVPSAFSLGHSLPVPNDPMRPPSNLVVFVTTRILRPLQ